MCTRIDSCAFLPYPVEVYDVGVQHAMVCKKTSNVQRSFIRAQGQFVMGQTEYIIGIIYFFDFKMMTKRLFYIAFITE